MAMRERATEIEREYHGRERELRRRRRRRRKEESDERKLDFLPWIVVR
jgi:hypothetical protein